MGAVEALSSTSNWMTCSSDSREMVEGREWDWTWPEESVTSYSSHSKGLTSSRAGWGSETRGS